jgi:hypothetical protein
VISTADARAPASVDTLQTDHTYYIEVFVDDVDRPGGVFLPRWPFS